MISYLYSKEIFLRIYPNNDIQAVTERYIRENEKSIIKALKRCHSGNWQRFLNKDPMFKLALIYSYLPYIKSKYDKSGISEDIFFDTMSDIKIWIDDYIQKSGKIGLKELNWIIHHMNMNLFKVGRLQYQKSVFPYKKQYINNGIEIKYKDKVWSVHIPRGEKLNARLCEESFDRFEKFAERFVPEYPKDKFVCNSWFLYPENKSFMSKSSNIITFAKMFDLIESKEYPSITYRFIFNADINNKKLTEHKKRFGNYGFIENLPNETSLQKSCINYILNGGSLGDGFGVKI